MDQKVKILLIGGNGFLGSGLQRELKKRNIDFRSIDKDEIDVANPDNIVELSNIMKDYTHLVLLASLVGAKLFNETPQKAADINRKIFKNFKIAMMLSNQCYDVTYYSSSELFWNLDSIDDVISDESQYHLEIENPRSLYSIVKYDAEIELKEYQNLSNKISHLKILRPFNISGQGQKRGVVFEMVKSAILNNKIEYADDTTRSLTDVDDASSMAVDCILHKNNINMNIVDYYFSLYMSTLANLIKEAIDKDVELVKLAPDKNIRYRHVSKVDANIDYCKEKIFKIVKQILTENNWKNS